MRNGAIIFHLLWKYRQTGIICFSLLYKRAQMSIQEYNDMIIILHAIKLLKH